MAEHPRQGEVWLTEFQEGWERPAIVVSRNELNRGRLILVVPCTSSRVEERAAYPNHVLFQLGTAGLTKNTVAQVHLIQPIESSFLAKRMGQLTDEELGNVLLALAWVVDLFDSTGQG